MSTITFGDTPAPSTLTTNFNALFSTTLAKYQKSLTDNIASSNPIFWKMKNSGMYEADASGTHLQIPLLYQLNPVDSYDGHDTLNTDPIEGLTHAIFEWRQLATPVVYSMKELLQNQGSKLIDLVKTKIMQAELGFQESFPTHFLQGNGAGALSTPYQSAVTGAYSIEPLPKLVEWSTITTVVGNIDPATYTWWKNKTKTSSATTMTGFMQEMDNLYNTCSQGTGGSPDLIWTDQTTYELLVQAAYLKYRQVSEDPKFPFENFKFKKAVVTWDEKMPDVENSLTNCDTAGTLYMLNTKFIRCKYFPGRDFEMLKDDSGKTFAKPTNADSRVGHMAWMGNFCVNNRRKHGVMGSIARTLTAS